MRASDAVIPCRYKKAEPKNSLKLHASSKQTLHVDAPDPKLGEGTSYHQRGLSRPRSQFYLKGPSKGTRATSTNAASITIPCTMPRSLKGLSCDPSLEPVPYKGALSQSIGANNSKSLGAVRGTGIEWVCPHPSRVQGPQYKVSTQDKICDS